MAALEILPGYSLRVRFMDGLEGVVRMADLVHSADAGVFARLADAALFGQACVVHGVVTWPGEIDVAPDAIYRAIREHGECVLR